VNSFCVPSQYPTIQKAVNAASVNGTVLVAAGTFMERVVLNKTVHLVGSGGGVSIIDGQGQGPVVSVTHSGASVSGFTVENAGVYGSAVSLFQSNNVSVTGNTISSDPLSARSTGAGVDLYLSNHTLIDGNVFVGNLFGVNMTSSGYNRVTNNLMTSNDLDGVRLVDSAHNFVFQNKFVGGEEGVEVTGQLSTLNNVTRNLIRGMSFAGVFMGYFANGNLLNENTFILNHIGVDLQNATGSSSAPPNIFYHNSFLRSGFRNVNHVVASDIPLNWWDNRSFTTGPKGGNYWDDYTGTDPDGDGIGDNMLPWNSVDYHPLIVPFVPVPIAVVSVLPGKMSGVAPFTVSFTADVLGTLKPFIYSWDFGDNSPTSDLSAPTHTYSVVGNYNVSLLVKDTSGSTSLGSVIVSVVPAPGNQTSLYLAIMAVAIGATLLGFIYYRRRRSRKKN